MPLSEQEQRLLDEMERSLYGHDADFVSTAGDKRGRPSYRSIALGALLAIVGIAGLIVAVILHQPIIGIVGFVAMLGGVLVAITPSKKPAPEKEPRPGEFFTQPSKTSGAAQPGGNAQSTSFMDRMGERWERRDGGDK
ncbi:DUF3040 domain-containing protein [Mycetocola tolaasinivorans]|uniref:DUF3040 domain-containing protein n=1 Tax=Mycetocola tolaasinivorans TaxID=76635 RepID=A0A3L7AEK0_9MICO|nr:DUF3040 domain-containing protein [Mycetocola tolaasinivorans]RLP78128.1 DUF3040 domain-containing protein [Mycetocola tolaasinivorans]